MVKTKSKQFFRSTPLRLLLAVVLILIVIAGYWALKLRHTDNKEPATNVPSTINLNPPTEQEKAEAEAHKNSLGQPSPSTTASTDKKQVAPVITSADKQEVNAYVSGVFEEGGTCTATLTKDGQTVTKTSKGFGNVSYTSCEPINVDGSLTASSWTVIVSYSSNTAEGQSQPKVFTVD